MSSRRLLTAVVVTAGLFGLAGCNPDGTSDDAGAARTVAAPTSPAAGQGAPSKTPAATPSDDASGVGAEPGTDCTPNTLPARHKIVQPVRQPNQNIMYAKATKFACDPNDGHYEPTGTETAYHFAPMVKAELATGGGQTKAVILGDLWEHIGDCLSGGAQVKDPYSCSAFPVYEITLDSAGRVTEIKEIWHS